MGGADCQGDGSSMDEHLDPTRLLFGLVPVRSVFTPHVSHVIRCRVLKESVVH
jgi:hypothetical protein